MPKLLVFVLLLFNYMVYSQDNTVNVIAFGDGKTKDEATNAALRHCIEKTFGVFVTTNTQVVNDELVKDDIATIASGNIVSYDVISEQQKGDIFSVTVSASVSPDNIVKTYKNKGYSFEVNGNVYAQNIQKEKFYKEQEPIIVQEFLSKVKNYNLFDTFNIVIGKPFLLREYKNALGRYFDGIERLDIKEFVDKIIPENYFYQDSHAQRDPLRHVYGGINSLKIVDNDERIEYNKNETYAYPILYTPHFNPEMASNIASLIANFFSSISIKDQTYVKYYGDWHEVIFLIQYLKRKKRTTEVENTYYLRNPETIKIIEEFMSSLVQRAFPTSLSIKGGIEKLNRKSFWFKQYWNNSTILSSFSQTYSLGKKDKRIVPKYNLGNNVIETPLYIYGSGNQYKYLSLSYKPSLILFNVTEIELNKISNLNFSWK